MASRITTMFAAAGLAVVLPFGASAAAAASASGPAVPAPAIAATAAAGGTGTSTFGTQPVPHSNSDNRAAFAVSATPGARSSDAIRVSNFGDAPVTLHIYASDAVNTSEGGYDVKPSGVRPVDVGTWVKFDKQQPFITIPAKSAVDLPFTISVPADATPGDHPGGIVAALTTPSLDSHGNRINLEQRVGTRIYVRIAGTLKPQLTVRKLSAVYHNDWNPFGDGSATVTYQVANTGNVRLSAKQAVHVTSLLGGSVPSEALRDMEQLLPGNSITVRTTLKGITPSFVSTAHVSVDPAPVPGDLDPQVVAVDASASMASVPWIWLAVLLLIGGLAFEVFRQRRNAGRPVVPAAGSGLGGSGGAVKASKAPKTPKAAKAPKTPATPASSAAPAAPVEETVPLTVPAGSSAVSAAPESGS